MSGIREGEQKVIMAKRKVDIDLDYKGWNNAWKESEGIFRGRDTGWSACLKGTDPFTSRGWNLRRAWKP